MPWPWAARRKTPSYCHVLYCTVPPDAHIAFIYLTSRGSMALVERVAVQRDAPPEASRVLAPIRPSAIACAHCTMVRCTQDCRHFHRAARVIRHVWCLWLESVGVHVSELAALGGFICHQRCSSRR